MDFREACKPYFQNGPIMSRHPGKPIDGNGILYTAIYYILLDILGEITPADIHQFNKAIDSVTVRDKNGALIYGLINRGPLKKEHEAHDNLIGAAAMGQVMNQFIGTSFWAYGKRKFWIYDNTPQRTLKNFLRSWHYRLPGVVQHYKLCARQKLNWFDKFWWALDIVSTTYSETGSTSGRNMDFIKVRSYIKQDRRYKLCDWAVKVRNKKLSKRYPNLISDVFSIYFEKEHPFALYTVIQMIL